MSAMSLESTDIKTGSAHQSNFRKHCSLIMDRRQMANR